MYMMYLFHINQFTQCLDSTFLPILIIQYSTINANNNNLLIMREAIWTVT
jgi:hypothetical protein